MRHENGAALLVANGLVTRYPVQRGIVGTLMRKPRQLVHAVEGVSFVLRRGEMLALVGESGCGKTTVAQTVMRLVDPVAGTIQFHDREITRLEGRDLRTLRRQIQVIYQDPYESLDPRFRVRQTVEEPLIAHRLGNGAERRASVLNALTRVGLTPPELYLDRFPHELSGGERQRVALASGLALEPEVLIADEPVSMLDVSVRAGILALLDGLRASGLTILMITHDLSTAAHYADRIAVMYLGRIVEEGSARELVSNPRHPYTQALLSAVPKPDPRDRRSTQILKGEAPNPVQVPPGCRFHPRCPFAFDRCMTDDPEELLPVGDVGQRAACWLVVP